MPRRIDVEIGRNGEIKVEYSGFEGETCFEEKEALEKALKEMGLWAIPITIVRKTSSQISDEIGMEQEKRERVAHP
ncbi:MAG: DUF2997 domain-containing protein [Candidatus Fermentithermobacillus carboniphilus]|uniref:DUF2997 domain-containing protein n=1 Tax=Candidatus Fermentithermobacillus carboniphilus TaxID=3085328 RepID=A0AAT9LCE7_9FIRM|nr:MAG: DUF2997 domain-containing protein [Candidatus Fermentithermobacillus carboniphilus]